MSSQRFAFVDVETTGSSPLAGRVTEVAVIGARRAAGGDWAVTDEWTSLVNPRMAIPAEIQFLTGITPAMVAGAPTFGELAGELLPRLAGPDTVFVAHHARFDYGFLKAEFARCGIEFGARTLCTVRLSKLLDPDRSPHSLDALIARHRLPVDGRHRALGDARVLWEYLNAMYRRRGDGTVEPAIRLLLKQPSLPAHLPADTLTRVPRGPGVYLFYGLNEHPLYIGKSRHLRERVSSHFVLDWRSERGLRLASETRRIEWQETAGDLGAQLLEQRLIRERMPAHNVASRRRERLLFLEPLFVESASAEPAFAEPVSAEPFDTKPAAPLRFTPLSALSPADLPGRYGPFTSRAAVHRLLTDAAPQHGLCLRALRIERGPPGSPCFNRQLGRCAGCCVGAEAAAGHLRRVAEVLANHRIPAWPWPGPVALVERALVERAEGERAKDGAAAREDWHVFDRWCHLGTAGDEAAAQALAARAGRRFEPAAYRLLRGALTQHPNPARPQYSGAIETPPGASCHGPDGFSEEAVHRHHPVDRAVRWCAVVAVPDAGDGDPERRIADGA